MQAMILAAGYGTRLRPYTELLPKPLFPVCNQPLLLRIIGQLRAAGCEHLVINAHHLADSVAAAVAGQPGVTLQREGSILGTGGGLGRARRHFEEGPVLVSNGDIFHTIDYRLPLAAFAARQPAALLVVHDFPRFNKVIVAGDGRIHGFAGNCQDGERLFAFTGIHVLARRCLDMLPENGYFDVIDLYRRLIADGETVLALEVREHYWRDIGTPEDYLALHDDILHQAHLRAALDLPAEGNLVLGTGVKLDGDIQVEDWAVVGDGACIGAGVRLRRAVVWPHRSIAAHSLLHDRIVC